MNISGRRGWFAAVASAALAGVATATAQAAAKTYKYRCPKCKLIQEYGSMGSRKCPNDGTTMIRMN